jgi:alpha-L-fucosidase
MGRQGATELDQRCRATGVTVPDQPPEVKREENRMDSTLVDQTYLPSAIPTPRQLEYQDWEMGMFFHFGIRTFYEGRRDWEATPMPADGFRPSGLNCDNWIVSAKRAGMRYAVLVCKHHDGFANWPTQYSTYSVAHTPWKEGKGDVVREFTDACRRHGMHVGLYYSPAEMGNPKFQDERAYDEHFLNQLRELLTGYGAIDMLWFDGCGSDNHQYDWRRIVAEIRRLQPNLLIFNMGEPDYRWGGNEAGIASLPTWNTVARPRFSDKTEAAPSGAAAPVWLPPEYDCMMRAWNWFFEEADVHTVKPLEELMGLYYLSVGRGANLIINIGPDRRGLLPDADRQALLAFGAEVRRRFGNPVATMTDGRLTDTGWEYVAKRPFFLDHIILQEELRQGEAVRRFAVHIRTVKTKQLITIYEGRNIGHKAICRLPLIGCTQVVVEITQADRPVKLRSVSLINSTGLTYQC